MNNWATIKQNSEWLSVIEQTCYASQEFPLEVRDILADWFALHDVRESFLSFDETDLTYQKYICEFLQKMVEELDQKTSSLLTAESPHLRIYQFRMLKMLQQMKVNAKRDPLVLFKRIQESLLTECWQFNKLSGRRSTGTDSSSNETSSMTFSDINRKITEDMYDVRLTAHDAVNKVGEMSSAYKSLQERYRQGQVSEQQCCLEVAQLREKVGQVFITVKGLIGQTEMLFQRITRELDLFKDEQRFVFLGKAPTRNLQTIDKWFEGTSDSLGMIRQMVLHFITNLCTVIRPDLQSDLEAACTQIDNLHKQMVLSSLVIETEPIQIVRKDSKSSSIVLRVLTCSSNTTILNKNSKLKAILIDEEGLNELVCMSGVPEYIPRNTESATLLFSSDSPCIQKNQVEFKHLQMSRRGKKKLEKNLKVVEEKFCIYFSVDVHIYGNISKLWTLSLPLTITAHSNQDDDAWSAILWHNAFPTSNRQSLQVPDEVEWSSLIEVINLRFLFLGKELTEANKNYLKEKVFRGNVPQNEMLTRKMFCKDPFLERKICNPSSGDSNLEDSKKTWLSFWDWLYCCLKLLSWTPLHGNQSLRKQWRENRIVGFMSETDVRNELAAASLYNPGTFIIRFPDRMVDYIGLYFYNPFAENPAEALCKFAYSIDDLSKISLQDRIHQNSLLTHVYPGDVDKSVIEGSHCTNRRITDGYITPGIMEYIPQ